MSSPLLGTELVHAAIDAYFRDSSTTSFDPSQPMARLHESAIGADEIKAAIDCLLTDRVTQGPKVRAFEGAFAAATGSRFAIAVNSGSSANLLAMQALTNPATEHRLEPGDEVIVPAICWATTVWPLVQMGLIPVFADVDPDSFNLTADSVAAAISPKTRAVMAVHVYGNPCDLDALTQLCQERGLMLIEDCCQAQGARYRGRPVGGFGRIGFFSFYYSHHITTIEGGICVTDDPALADRMRIHRSYGWTRDVEDPAAWAALHPAIDRRALFVDSGFNLRMTDLQAAIGLVQLAKLEAFAARRRELAAWYKEALGSLSPALRFQRETPGGTHSWQNFSFVLEQDSRELMQFLEQRRIETRPIVCGNMARQPACARFPHRAAGRLTVADQLMRRGFSIGCHQYVGQEERRFVVNSIGEFFR